MPRLNARSRHGEALAAAGVVLDAAEAARNAAGLALGVCMWTRQHQGLARGAGRHFVRGRAEHSSPCTRVARGCMDAWGCSKDAGQRFGAAGLRQVDS